MRQLGIILVFLFSMPVFGQAVCPFEWATQVRGSFFERISGIATDDNGNSYVTGTFIDTVNFDSMNLFSSGRADFFVAKADSSGNFLWATNAGGNNDDYGYHINIDTEGNSYVTGAFSDTAIFGDTALTSYGGFDVFFAKLDGDGNFLWATRAGGPAHCFSSKIVCDTDGNSYITGEFVGTAIFGNTTLVSSGDFDIFVTKLDPSGNFLWATKAGGSDNNIVTGISIDTDGNSFITGHSRSDTTTFGSYTLTRNGGNGYDIFIAKLDPSGNFLWATKAGGIMDDVAYDIATDSAGNSFITGTFGANARFGNITLSTQSSYSDIFIAKVDSSGNFLWVTSAGGSSVDIGFGLTIDANVNIYVTGFFETIATFGNTKLISSGMYDIFITCLDSSGSFLWATKAGGSENDKGHAISTDAIGNSYVIGEISDTAIFGSTTLFQLGGSSFFVKVSEKVLSISPIQSINLPCGKNTVINGSAFNYAGFQWSPTTGLSSDTILNPIASPTQTTEYTLTAWNSCGDTLREKLTVIVDPIGIEADANRANISCGDTTRLFAALDTVISGMNYSWSPAVGLDDPASANPVASPYTTTTYTVTATTPNGCTSIDSVTITVNNTNAPNIPITSSTGEFKLCTGGLTLSSTGYVKYKWSTGSTDSFITVTQTGWYKLSAYPASGCPGIDSVEVIPFGNITSPMGTTLCDKLRGQKLTLIAALGMDSYQWSTGEMTQSIAINQAGNYFVLMSKGSCTGSDTINTVMTGDSAIIDFSHADTGLTAYFTLIGAGIDSVFWDFGDGNTSTDFNPTHAYTQSGNYDVKVLVKYICGINADTTKTITVSDPNSVNGVKKFIPKIYPNPAGDKLWIELPKEVNESFSCEILNMQGQLVKQWKDLSSKTAELDLENLSGGVYVLQVHYNGSTYIERLIKLQH